jgi:hypothetical protein
MKILFHFIFRNALQIVSAVYISFVWVQGSLIILSWIQEGIFITILIVVALIGSMYLFQHLLLKFQTGLNARSKITLRGTLRPFSIAAGLATFFVVFILALFPIELSIKFTGIMDIFGYFYLLIWFILPLIAYAVVFVRERNRVLNSPSR